MASAEVTPSSGPGIILVCSREGGEGFVNGEL
jgi:hypothetical protein